MSAPVPQGGQDAAPRQEQQQVHPLRFRLLPSQPTDWDPASAVPTLNVRLDGCIVPSEAAAEGARVSFGHVVVIDDFVSDATRQELLDFLTAPAAAGDAAVAGSQAADSGAAGAGAAAATDAAGASHGGFALPPDRWERATADMAGGAATWGVRPEVLAALAAGQLPALREVGARLVLLYPECDIAHLPSDAIQGQPEQQRSHDPGPAKEELLAGGSAEEEKEPAPKRRRAAGDGGAAAVEDAAAEEGGAASDGAGGEVDCNAFVANAAVEGDAFRYHVDADPTSFPDGSRWVQAYGDYCNGEPGRPLLVSCMLYLNPEWERDWGADTLFLDGQTDAGVFVRPRPCRAVLFDQDILHRVSPPLPAAGGRPRFSLVWKLALLPRAPGQALCVARPEWGPPTSVGSAARVDAVMRQLAAEKRAAP